MKIRIIKSGGLAVVIAAMLLFLAVASADAQIDLAVIPGLNQDLTDPTFNLTARTDHISTADGGSILLWGFDGGGGRAQYPGPTLIVRQGDVVTVSLTNQLTVAGTEPAPKVSIVFPGHQVSASGGTPGLLTNEASPEGADTVTYTFTATHPGTYMYHSGTRPELEVEMGLLGALIVRPSDFDQESNRTAYGPGTEYDHEYLFLHSEMDPIIHQWVEALGPDAPQLKDEGLLSDYFPKYWFYNGRVFPDLLQPAPVAWLPTQPYNTLPLTQIGQYVLQRYIGGGRDWHPTHPHGAHARTVARDGRLLFSGQGAPRPDISQEEFTYNVPPGGTIDAIWDWTGYKSGWDIFGVSTDPDNPGFEHLCEDASENRPGSEAEFDPDNDCPGVYAQYTGDCFDDVTWEYCPDHDKPIPVVLPGAQDLTFGGLWSGSPYMGALGDLPPGEGGLNPFGAFTFPWHSHSEKELANFDIFPGGMLTFVFVIPH